MQKYRMFMLSFLTTLLILLTLWGAAAVIEASETRIHGAQPTLRLELPRGDDRFYLTVGDALYRIEVPALGKIDNWAAAHRYLLPAPLQILYDFKTRSSA